MASGILGTADLAANTLTTIYEAPASTLAAVNFNICNRGSDGAAIRVALATTDTPTDAEWIEYDTALPANQPLERTAALLAATQRIVAWTDTANVSVVVWGEEQSV